MNPAAMTLVLFSTLSFFSWSMFRRFRQYWMGKPDANISWQPEEIFQRLGAVALYAMGQKKMLDKLKERQRPAYKIAGVAHAVIFFGFMVLTLNSVLLWGRGYDSTFDFFGLLSTSGLPGQLYSFAKEIFAALVVIGALGFYYLRVAKGGKDSGDPQEVKDKTRMTTGFEPQLILFIIVTMMLADFLYVAATLAQDAQAHGQGVHLSWFEPVASPLASALIGLPRTTLRILEQVGFWWHSAWVLLFLNILPFSKHFHIITVLPNVFFYDRRPNVLPKS